MVASPIRQPARTIWLEGRSICILDQTRLPHEVVTRRLARVEEVAEAITMMQVRGAPLIGVTAAWGMALAATQGMPLARARELLAATRPTAVNLRWALDEVERAPDPWRRAAEITEEEVGRSRAIGEHGLPILRAAHKRERLEVLTHCNAGWLAAVEHGTALAPVYLAHEAGIPVHVWVDETRPRNQGARLTAWELGARGVPHTVIADNAGGHLMQKGRVDLCIVGADRVTRNGDVCNKIGTYLKALAARDNGVPFYAALPVSTIDWSLESGAEIPIEERDPSEVHTIEGVRTTPVGSHAANWAFDLTPARLVTALITERGVCAASTAGLAKLYPS
jgi:methylthioribose-1-phosphate isomerase